MDNPEYIVDCSSEATTSIQSHIDSIKSYPKRWEVVNDELIVSLIESLKVCLKYLLF